jgi:hypothetical protein
MFFKIVGNEVRQLAALQGISDVETEQVIRIFQEAMQNPYLDERHIYQRLAETSSGPE